ncbi:MAG: 4Fe-4S binding protein [Bacteroidales bacterium]|nr:4Fe-4S binding protein [Bacteroidales bacterium]
MDPKASLVKGVVSYRISDGCVACGNCLPECPVQAISEGRIYMIDSKRCISCGICSNVCIFGAVERYN